MRFRTTGTVVVIYENQRSNGPVNAHLILGLEKHIYQMSPNLTLSLNRSRSTKGRHLYTVYRP